MLSTVTHNWPQFLWDEDDHWWEIAWNWFADYYWCNFFGNHFIIDPIFIFPPCKNPLKSCCSHFVDHFSDICSFCVLLAFVFFLGIIVYAIGLNASKPMMADSRISRKHTSTMDYTFNKTIRWSHANGRQAPFKFISPAISVSALFIPFFFYAIAIYMRI